jgi:2-polyprenyl-3-methyl-5-hydroxy-6-metoxy-1,4-benzoquinol methylase
MNQKLIELQNLLKSKNDPELNAYLETLQELTNVPAVQESNDAEFEELKKLLESDAWPAAVDPTLICDPNSEEDKLNRAEGILELLIEESLENKKFLDFGCGEGHVPFKAIDQKVSSSVGYDIKEDSHWADFKNCILTTDLEIVKSNGPYDVILVYDVLDHMNQSEMAGVLTQIKDLLSDSGTIYLRTHPFCSRHATHLYHKINKAFVHLVFTASELEKLGYETPINANIMWPIKQYNACFINSNLKQINSNTLRERIEDFFKNNSIIEKRLREKNSLYNNDFPSFQCEQQFLDFILKK